MGILKAYSIQRHSKQSCASNFLQQIGEGIHMGVMFSCLHTFGHILYVKIIILLFYTLDVNKYI